MKDTKRAMVLLQPFDYEGIEEYLKKKAREGWQLDSPESDVEISQS